MVASASLIGVLTTQDHMALLPAVVLALIGSMAFGAINAAVVVGFGIDAFIATLGSMTWLGGVTEWFTHGNVLSGLPRAWSTSPMTPGSASHATSSTDGFSCYPGTSTSTPRSAAGSCSPAATARRPG